MSESIDKSLSAAAGEYLVLGELLKRGNLAFLAQGPTQPDWDILVVTNCTNRRVQVKTVDWPCSKNKAANFRFPLEFDYVVIVLLQRNKKRSRFFLLKKDEIEQHLSVPNPSRKGGQRTLTISDAKLKELKSNEDNWEMS